MLLHQRKYSSTFAFEILESEYREGRLEQRSDEDSLSLSWVCYHIILSLVAAVRGRLYSLSDMRMFAVQVTGVHSSPHTHGHTRPITWYEMIWARTPISSLGVRGHKNRGIHKSWRAVIMLQDFNAFRDVIAEFFK